MLWSTWLQHGNGPARPLSDQTLKIDGISDTVSELDVLLFLAKGCTNTGWLYIPLLVIHTKTCGPPYNYALFGVSGLVSFSYSYWLRLNGNDDDDA
ncbi:hypothetical protein EVAR_65527_1 [Eumeta japonica]|uniref:Uncharacterized protein n=1 Tax=Eumeta variegata TaxID=151549 RepID=A0A4C1ZUF7_EUMVA|nr:hypothetical protein EVAR_65527_1 [Eumeta japonica]